MVKIWATISAFLTVFQLSAQVSLYEDSNVGNVEPEVRLLAQRITAKVETDDDKIRLIYKWITENIDYDGRALKSPRSYHSPSDVIKSGKAICYGYAQLFRDMCTSCGILSYVVTGYGFDKGIPYNLPEEANHAWNSVFVDGQWKLVDVTWGSGDDSDEYLFTSPDKFSKSHIPSYYGWRMTPCTDSRYFNPVICGLSDSLNQFFALSTLERAIAEAKADYMLNSSLKNRELLGHSYIYLAIDIKEKADFHRDSSSIALYSQSLDVFEKGASFVDSLHDWQVEAWAYTILNKATMLYNTLAWTSYTTDTLEFICDEFERAISVLETIENSISANAAYEQSQMQLVGLQEELNRLKK